MEEQLISFETAKLAKEKGFNINTKHWYDQTEVLNPVKGARGAMMYENIGYAPTQSLLQKWLREVHNIHIDIPFYHSLNESKPFGLFMDMKRNNHWDYVEYTGNDAFATYEDALEHGLQEALKII